MNPYSEINWRDAPMTPEREIFREFATGKISQEVYNKTQSVLEAEGSHRIQPLKYPTCPQSMLDYCELRIKHKQDAHYDQIMSKAITEWISKTRNVYDENKKDSDVLVWAMGNVLKIKGHPGLEKLADALDRITKNENEFEPEAWSKCITVLKIDGEYRVRRDSGKVRTG